MLAAVSSQHGWRWIPPEDELLGQFDPASLVKSKEGTFSVPSTMKKYLNKHMKRCLSKEEREAIFKEHPKPDLYN